MTELQLGFLLDIVVNYVVIATIANLAFGRGRIWVVGHGALLATGGVYAWAAMEYSALIGTLVAVLSLVVWAAMLSAVAALLPGDRFVVVSLASAYAAYALSFAVFGDGIASGIPGAITLSQKHAAVAAAICVAALLSSYLLGFPRSRLDPLLLIARDEPLILTTSGLGSKPTAFWLHFVSCIPVGLIGILVVVFRTGYSGNMHSASKSLLLFVLVFGFGTNTIIGCAAASLCISSIERAVQLVLASDWGSAPSLWMMRLLGIARETDTASNIAVSVTQVLLAVLLILAVRYRPEGLFTDRSRWMRQ